MKEALVRTLLASAFFGGVATAGLLFVLFWRTFYTSQNAGVMIDGIFRPYHQDSSIHAIGLGGGVLLVAGVTGLTWAWRRVNRGEPL